MRKIQWNTSYLQRGGVDDWLALRGHDNFCSKERLNICNPKFEGDAAPFSLVVTRLAALTDGQVVLLQLQTRRGVDSSRRLRKDKFGMIS